MDISLEEVVFNAEWAPEAVLPDDPPPFVDSSQDDIINISVEQEPEKEQELEKELEPEKEKPVSRSRCLRSTAPREPRRRSGLRDAGPAPRT